MLFTLAVPKYKYSSDPGAMILSPFEFLDNLYKQVKLNPQQAQSTFEEARDNILSNHKDAIDCAAALFDAATSFNQKPPSDAEWRLLDDIRVTADRTLPSNDETRKRRALLSLTAIWSSDVVRHYGWEHSSRTTVELLRQCALAFPDFELQIAPLANYILVRRHEESLFNSRVPSIGEHRQSSKGALAHSPLTTSDIQFLAFIGKNGDHTTFVAHAVTMDPRSAFSPDELKRQQRWCGDDFELEVRGKTLASLRPVQTQNFLLGHDRFGVLVPKRFALTPVKQVNASARMKSRTRGDTKLSAPVPYQSKESGAEVKANNYKNKHIQKRKAEQRDGGRRSERETQADFNPRGKRHCATDKVVQQEKDSSTADSGVAKHVTRSAAPPDDADLLQYEPKQQRQSGGFGHDDGSHSFVAAPLGNEGTVSGNARSGRTRAVHYQSLPQRDGETIGGAILDALDLATDLLPRRQFARKISLDFAIRQRHSNLVKAYTDRIWMDPSSQAEYQVRKSWLRPTTKWAKIFTSPGSGLGRGESATEDDADVFYATGEEFFQLSRQGKVFTKPVVIKENFSDSSVFTVEDFASLLIDRYPRNILQVRALGQSTTDGIEVPAFVQKLLPEIDSEPGHRQIGLNALDFQGLTACSRPKFTHLRRYQLLKTLSEADTKDGPGKRIARGGKRIPYDISDSLSFNILGLEGAFSGPHMDALAGTWVRNLDGIKFWMVVRNDEMTSKDRDAFYQAGSEWLPDGRERLIVLEPDDVLFMPPGVQVIHAVHTPKCSLMEGGMIWDESNLLAILSILQDLGRHQSSTNEPIPFQLPRIIEQLEAFVSADPERFNKHMPDFQAHFESAIHAIKQLGCKCSKQKCSPSQCKCFQEDRRCTGFCDKHAELPPNFGETCMREDTVI